GASAPRRPAARTAMIRRHGKGLRRRRWHDLRERRPRGIFLLPSLLTTGNLFCGFFALLLTVENRYTEAALAIFVAMIMDILDGLPTPAAAGLVVSSVILLKGVELSAWLLLTIAVGTYVAALLMVSTFRYWSFKEFDFARRRPLWTLLVMVLSVMIVATRHEVFLFLIFGGYAVSGPLRRLIVGRAPAALPADQVTKEHP